MSPAVAPRIRGVSMDARSLILRLLEREPSRYELNSVLMNRRLGSNELGMCV